MSRQSEIYLYEQQIADPLNHIPRWTRPISICKPRTISGPAINNNKPCTSAWIKRAITLLGISHELHVLPQSELSWPKTSNPNCDLSIIIKMDTASNHIPIILVTYYPYEIEYLVHSLDISPDCGFA